MIPIEAIRRLRSLGYSFYLGDEGLRYLYSGEGVPDEAQAKPLLRELYAYKAEVKEMLKNELNSFSASHELLLQEINTRYIPGAIDFAKKHTPDIWAQILATEDKLSAIWVSGGEMTDFEEAQSCLQHLYLKIMEIFKSEAPRQKIRG